MRRGVHAALLLALGGFASAIAQEGWRAPARERHRVNPVAAGAPALQKGQALYQRHCASCHGAKGRGDGPAARFGSHEPGDLSDPELHRRLTDGEALWKITQGRREGPEVAMPGFADEIPSEEDRWKVVLFLRTLAARPTP